MKSQLIEKFDLNENVTFYQIVAFFQNLPWCFYSLVKVEAEHLPMVQVAGGISKPSEQEQQSGVE